MVNKIISAISWISATIAAIIMLQTLYFKFSGAEESVYIFTKIGLEPVGRYASGIAELIASILILIPATRGIGAILGTGIMAGAILSHITILGLEVMNDKGLLFIYAIITFTMCMFNTWIYRKQIPLISKYSQ